MWWNPALSVYNIPIRGQYEQRCNAAALAQMGVTVLDDADTDHFAADISNWLNLPELNISLEANNIMETLEMVMELGSKQTQRKFQVA